MKTKYILLRSWKQKYHWSKESQWPDGSLKKRFGNAQETRTTFGKLALIYHSKQREREREATVRIAANCQRDRLEPKTHVYYSAMYYTDSEVHMNPNEWGCLSFFKHG